MHRIYAFFLVAMAEQKTSFIASEKLFVKFKIFFLDILVLTENLFLEKSVFHIFGKNVFPAFT